MNGDVFLTDLELIVAQRIVSAQAWVRKFLAGQPIRFSSEEKKTRFTVLFNIIDNWE